jgi:hypothetical protein
MRASDELDQFTATGEPLFCSSIHGRRRLCLCHSGRWPCHSVSDHEEMRASVDLHLVQATFVPRLCSSIHWVQIFHNQITFLFDDQLKTTFKCLLQWTMTISQRKWSRRWIESIHSNRKTPSLFEHLLKTTFKSLLQWTMIMSKCEWSPRNASIRWIGSIQSKQWNHFFVRAFIEDDVQSFGTVDNDYVTASVITKKNWIISQQQLNHVLVRAPIEDDTYLLNCLLPFTFPIGKLQTIGGCHHTYFSHSRSTNQFRQLHRAETLPGAV